jgi:hypothetical protein
VIAAVDFVELWAEILTGGRGGDGTLSLLLSPAPRRTTITPIAPFTYLAEDIARRGVGSAGHVIRYSRRAAIVGRA